MGDVPAVVGALPGAEPYRLLPLQLEFDLTLQYVHEVLPGVGEPVAFPLAGAELLLQFGSFGNGVGMESSRGAQNAVFRAYRYGPDRTGWLAEVTGRPHS